MGKPSGLLDEIGNYLALRRRVDVDASLRTLSTCILILVLGKISRSRRSSGSAASSNSNSIANSAPRAIAMGPAPPNPTAHEDSQTAVGIPAQSSMPARDSEGVISPNFNGSDSDPGSGSSEEFDELEDCMLSIRNGVDCLYNFSIAIRNSNPTQPKREKWESIDLSHYEPLDIGHIQEKFPGAPEYLTRRLGKGNVKRRQFLKYKELHRTKIAAPEHSDVNDEAVTISQTATTVQTYAGDPNFELVPDINFDSRSDGNASGTSFGSTGSTSDLVNLKEPSPPDEVDPYNGSPFECQFCFLPTIVKGRDSWL